MPTPTSDFPASYDAVYVHYFPILFRFGLKQLQNVEYAKDLAQDTLIQFWKKRDPNITQKNSLESFLFQILKNRIVDHYRKQQIKYRYNTNFDPKNTIEPASTLFDVEDRIQKVYTLLPEKTVEIFKASRDDGLRYKEIATAFRISVKSVEFHVSKALRAFKNEFDSEELG